MENQVNMNTVCEAILQVREILEPYLALANTHGAEFLSEGHWDKYVSGEVQTSLMQLSSDDLVNLSLLTMQVNATDKNASCDAVDTSDVSEVPSKNVPHASNQIKDLALFISQARNCHLENLDIVTRPNDLLPLEHQISQSQGIGVISEAMSEKKVHEVGIMVDTVTALHKFTQADLVVDVGSGKGYFASELSRKHKVPVIGFDSSDTNTHGASKRDKSLAKKWTGLERRSKRRQINGYPITSNEAVGNCCPDTGSTLTPDGCNGLSLSTDFTHIPCLEHSTQKDGSFSGSVNTFNTSMRNENPSLTEKDSAFDGGKSQYCEEALRKPTDLYVPMTLYVHPEMDLSKVIQKTAPHFLADREDTCRFFLSGLHTCGSLAVTTMQLFLQDPQAVGLCCVGCCYQLMDELNLDECSDHPSQQQTHFPLSSCGKRLGLHLGRNARNLASQSVHRIRTSGQLQGGDFVWRALLNVLLIELGIPVPERIPGLRGLNKKSKSFQQYAAAALNKLGLSEHMPESHVLDDLEARHGEAQARMSAFFQLKLILAPAIEGLVLLDRLAFLLEKKEVMSAHLIQLFDPVTSPRCFALVAWKNHKEQVLS